MSKRMIVMFVAMAVVVLPAVFGPALRAQAREGVTVHGHWAIDIRQPDGTLVSHTEFENALHRAGGFFLADILGRQGSAGSWLVILKNEAGPAPCTEVGGQSCSIGEHLGGARADTGQSADNLIVGVATGTLVLTGSVRAERAGSIVSVESRLSGCPSSVTPAACFSSVANAVDFSGTTLPASIAVTAGQIVQVKVTFSFS